MEEKSPMKKILKVKDVSEFYQMKNEAMKTREKWKIYNIYFEMQMNPLIVNNIC